MQSGYTIIWIFYGHEGHVGVASFSRLMYLKNIIRPYHIISNHTIPYHIISYHIISYHIISYHIYKTPSPYLTPWQVGTSSRFNLSDMNPWLSNATPFTLAEKKTRREIGRAIFPLNPGCLIGILILVYEPIRM